MLFSKHFRAETNHTPNTIMSPQGLISFAKFSIAPMIKMCLCSLLIWLVQKSTAALKGNKRKPRKQYPLTSP